MTGKGTWFHNGRAYLLLAGGLMISAAYAQTGKASDALRAIMVAPWKQTGWEELNHAVSTTS